jgi:histidine ammonia-lyase
VTVEPVSLPTSPDDAPLRRTIALDGRTLTPETVAAIAYGDAGVRLTAEARARNAVSRAALGR